MNNSVFNSTGNYTLLSGDQNDTVLGEDMTEVEARIHRFQMIKVIVLATVMTLILITSCKSMINVLGRYVTKRY